MSIQGGVRPEKTFGRKIKSLDLNVTTLFALLNSGAQVAAQQGGIRSGAGPPSPEADQGFIRRSGDQMIGALGFAPKLVTLTSSQVIDIAQDTINFTSRLIVSNGGSFKLKALDGGGTAGAARFNGQIIFIQGVATETIEIVHNPGSGDLTTGNFQTISANNYIVQGDEIIICQFDSTDNKWLIISVGAGWSQTPAVSDIDFATFDGINIDRLRFVISSGAPASGGDPSIYLDGSGDMVFNVALGDSFFGTIDNITSFFHSDGNTQLIAASGVQILELINADQGIIDLEQIGEVRFVGDDDAGGLTRNTYGRILVNADDVSSGTKDGRMTFFSMINNVSTAWMQVNVLGNNQIDILTELDMNSNFMRDAGDIIPGTHATFDLGSVTIQFDNIFVTKLQLRQSTQFTIRADGTGMFFELPLGDVFKSVIDGNIYGVLQANLFEIRSFATGSAAQYNMFQDVAAGIRAIGIVEYNANRTTGGKTAYVQTFARAENIGNTTFEGSYNINVAEAGALVTYMTFNFSQEGTIRAFKPLDMNGFDIILDADGDSKFVLGVDDVLTLNLAASAAFLFTTTRFDIAAKDIQLTEIAVPAAPGATSGRIFLDSADNILKIRKSASTVSLEGGGGGSQTPILQNVDYDGFDIFDISNVEFRNTTGAPAASVRAIYADAGGIIINVPTGDRLEISVNNIDALTIDTSDSIFSTDILPNISGVRNLGSGSLKWSGIFASIYNVATSQGMKAVGADLVLETPTGTDIIFREVGTQFLRMDGGLNASVFPRDIKLDGTNRAIRAFDATEIGFFVSNQSASVGAEGSIELPFTTTASPSDAQLNTAFGSFDGACGVSGSTASIPRWQIRVNNNWNQVDMVNSN